MKVAVSATGSSVNSPVDERFGRCAFFIVFDEDAGDVEAVTNNSVAAAEGAGIKSAGLILSNKVDVVITGRVGPKAMQALLAGKVAVYTGVEGSVAQTMDKYRQGLLGPLGIPNARLHAGKAATERP